MDVQTQKPIVVGIYGLPGSGKTHLISMLKSLEIAEHFQFFEGSALIAQLLPGGLQEFSALPDSKKLLCRQQAIRQVPQAISGTQKIAILAGHFSFWNEKTQKPFSVMTDDDKAVYTHILDLKVSPEILKQRRDHDTTRKRPQMTVNQIQAWQAFEHESLRSACYDSGIHYHSINWDQASMSKLTSYIFPSMQMETEEQNEQPILWHIDHVFRGHGLSWKDVILFDGDKTLSPSDSGQKFWQYATTTGNLTAEGYDPFKQLFSHTKWQYSYKAFKQSALIYQELSGSKTLEDTCRKVADLIELYPQFISLLQVLKQSPSIGVFVVTCGLQRVWQIILENAGLQRRVHVIGLQPWKDALVVTPKVKAKIVGHLQQVYKLPVTVFGDSPIDLPMMVAAKSSFVVVGKTQERSISMDISLQRALAHGLTTRQILMYPESKPRLDTKRIPVVDMYEIGKSLQRLVKGSNPLKDVSKITITAEVSAAQLLATPTRDARISGSQLRTAHFNIGAFIATTLLPQLQGLEKISIPYVQGHLTDGHRLRHEDRTTIFAVMRGGEPMAFGVNEVLKEASFVHINEPEDIKPVHIDGKLNLILVDSVINTGKSIVELIDHIRSIHSTIRIVVICGVLQSQALHNTKLKAALDRYANIYLLALRKSDNKFTGTKTIDTGNRLFNTTYMD